MSKASASPARISAARALITSEEGAHLDDALAAEAPPPGPDRDLAWFLAYGVCRRRGHIDAALRSVLSTPLAALDPPVRAVLRVGAMEILFARTKPHAVVHQAVEVARALGAARAHGLVNAVLRRAALPAKLSEADALDQPAWLLARWKQRYGIEATARWCEANQEPPPLFIVARSEGDPLPAGAIPATYDGRPVLRCYRAPESGAITSWEGFSAGGWWVQDLASVLVADLVPATGTVLDACAAPGGKTLRIASKGARVLSVDKDAARIQKINESKARLGPSIASRVETRAHDWEKGPLPAEAGAGRRMFDAVLVDAPCTGLGTVRRHPEIKWRRSEPDLFGAAALQARILDAASEHVRPGGTLVYAVCSPEPEESTSVVERFLAKHPAFSCESTLSTAPPRDGEDAHFAARLQRA